jgi:hypothetical protein
LACRSGSADARKSKNAAYDESCKSPTQHCRPLFTRPRPASYEENTAQMR